MSGVHGLPGARMEPGGAPGLVAAAPTEREQGGEKHLLHRGGDKKKLKNTPSPRQLPVNREARARSSSLSHSLDEEDPSVPADAVGPALRQGVPTERRRHDRLPSPARRASLPPLQLPAWAGAAFRDPRRARTSENPCVTQLKTRTPAPNLCGNCCKPPR